IYVKSSDIALLLYSLLACHSSSYLFFFYYYPHPRDLHSFPTRRSSDLRPSEEVAFKPVDNVRLAALCGPLDANLRQIENALDVTIARRGDRFSVAGAREKASQAAQALRRFYDQASRELTVEDIQLGLVEISHVRER